MSKNGVFNIAMGTYEQLLYGIDVDADTLLAAKDEQAATQAASVLRTTFAMPCHIGSIRTCASSSKYLATGSTDETLKVFDLVKRKEIGSIHHHSGAVTALKFFGVHLVCGSADGTISIWRTKKWELHAVLGQKKKAPVLDVAVHPSGRVLLSVAKDKRLKMWNLVNAKLIYKQKFDEEMQLVNWSPTGNHYALTSFKNVYIRNKENALVQTLAHSADVLCVQLFVSNQLTHDETGAEPILFAVTGGESKLVSVWNCNDGSQLFALSGHARR